ncbi:MAG: hypothetical protein JSV18_06825, partial [Candidatus Bathyarchaeota archaeon]
TFMYVNEVNNYYDNTVVEMKLADDEHSTENLEGYANGNDSSSVDVFMINRSPFAVNISRVWVMKTNLRYAWIFNSTNRQDIPFQMISAEQKTLTFNFTDIFTELDQESETKIFIIDVSTERGNKFSSLTNPLSYDDDNGWQTGTMNFYIQVIVLSDQGNDRYLIEIDELNGSHYDWIDSTTVQGQFFSVFSVPHAGTYNVTVENLGGSGHHVGNMTAVLTWIYPSKYCQFDDSGGPP